MRYQFELNSLTALLPHADDVEKSDSLEAWRKDPANRGTSKAGDDRSPAWTWATYLYADENVLAIPADNLMVCLRAAGSQMILKKQKTFKAITQSGIFIADEFIPLLTGGKTIDRATIDEITKLRTFGEQAEAVRGLGFRLFVKRARIGNAKHVRVRARFDQWSLRGTLEVTTNDITEENLRQIFEIAGNSIGLCDWRPNSPKSPGPFGRFTAKVSRV